MTTMYGAVLDGDIEGADLRETRAAAEADAKWLRGHPAVHDRRLYGHGGRVEVMAITQDEWTGEWVGEED